MLTAQDFRIVALESELQSLKSPSVVQGERSEEEGDEDDHDDDSDDGGDGDDGNKEDEEGGNEEDNGDEDKDEEDDDDEGNGDDEDKDDSDGGNGGDRGNDKSSDNDDDDDNNDDPPSSKTQTAITEEQPDVSSNPLEQEQPRSSTQSVPTEAETSKQSDTAHDLMGYLDLISFDEVMDEDEVIVEEQEKLEDKDSEANEIEIEKDNAVANEYISDAGTLLNENILKSFEDPATEIPADDATETPERKSMRSEWFKKVSEQPKLKTHYDVKGNYKGVIISWRYDASLKLFAIKRSDGIQYFGKTLRDLSSLPKCEIGRLSQLNLINRSNSDWAK